MDILRRRVLSFLATAIPALAVSNKSHALSEATGADRGAKAALKPASGTWAILEHVTDGTDPRVSVVAAPQFTPDIRQLAGSEVTLTGYLQAVGGSFGSTPEYLLSRDKFHCPYCYAYGRGSLVLASIDGHPHPSDKPVTIKGTLALQETDPSDFYFQLKNAKIV